jgi:hypothetical protein
MNVTALFVCQSKEHDSQTPDQGNIRLTAVKGGSEEAKKYFAYTPYGDLKLGILNTKAFEQFNPGETYLITIEKFQ